MVAMWNRVSKPESYINRHWILYDCPMLSNEAIMAIMDSVNTPSFCLLLDLNTAKQTHYTSGSSWACGWELLSFMRQTVIIQCVCNTDQNQSLSSDFHNWEIKHWRVLSLLTLIQWWILTHIRKKYKNIFHL